MTAQSIYTVNGGFKNERRRGGRVSLSWAIKLIRSNGSILQATTENLSSSGFYCIVGHQLMPGEELACHIGIPPAHVSNGSGPVSLLCHGRVARVDAIAPDRYGMGCVIEEYNIVRE